MTVVSFTDDEWDAMDGYPIVDNGQRGQLGKVLIGFPGIPESGGKVIAHPGLAGVDEYGMALAKYEINNTPAEDLDDKKAAHQQLWDRALAASPDKREQAKRLFDELVTEGKKRGLEDPRVERVEVEDPPVKKQPAKKAGARARGGG